ncbi:MAG: hypothetical protein HY360_05925 [Verrucomicrobia bacterium]|nr:hypothetical protein [Verrucomicrobiota bacterium]
MKFGLMVAAGLLVFVATSFAIERSEVSFYLSFEKGIEPDISSGDVEVKLPPGAEEDVPFDPAGLSGRACKLDDALSISYKSSDLFSQKEGTISFWLKPIGWKADGNNHNFFFAYADKGSFQIYRFWPGNNWVYFAPSADAKTWRFIGGATWWDGWTDGKWEHLAFTFKPGEQAFYINGKLMERKTTDLVEPEFIENNGIRLAAANKGAAQAFDEVIIFKRALTQPEVQSLVREPLNELARLAVPPMSDPVIDGKITSEKEWAGASALASWVDPVLGNVNKDDTKIRVGHGGKALNVLFACTIPEKFRKQRDLYVGSPLKISVKKKDGDIFQDDYFGVCLSPPGSKDVYFFGINGESAKRDEKNGDAGWNGEWSANQTRDDHVWIAEFSIPFALLGGNSSSEGAWGVNFLHGGRQMDLLESASFYQPRTKWPLAAMKCSPRKNSFEIDGFGDLAGGTLAFTGSLVNAEKAALEAENEVSIKDADKVLFGPEKKTITAKSGEKEKLESRHGLAEPACGNALLNIKDKAGELLLSYPLPFVFSRELSLKLRYYPTAAKLETVIDVGSSALARKVTGATIKIVPAGESKPAHSQTMGAFDALQKEAVVDCSKLPVGKYDVLVEINLGKSVVTLKEGFAKEAPPEWLGNKLGLIEKVPRPWTPLKLSGQRISCWGRVYSMGAAGLPEQVSILGKDVLAAPVRILVASGGKTQALPLGSFKESEVSDLKVSFKSRSAIGDITVSGDGWMEFDGFLKTTIQVSAAKPTVVDSLAIEIPIKPEFASYWSPAEYYPEQLGKSPKEKHESEACHGMRIGDEERGLQFTYINALKQILIPTEKEYIVRYEFMKTPALMEKPLEITFGLQALPVRPRSPIYRSFKVDDCTFTSDASKELFNISPLYTEGWSGHWNYLNFWNEQAFDKTYIEKLKAAYAGMWEKSRQTHCMYLNIVTMDANTPEYRVYRHEWAGRDAPPATPYDPATKTKANMVGINCEVQSYEDFYMWQLNKTVRYLTEDGKFPIHCYLDNTASKRNYMKRLFTIMKSVNPRNQVFVHMSGDNNMQAYGFADWLIEGEENSANYASRMAADPSLPKNYTKIINLDKVACRYSPFAFGDKFFLYQFWGWNKTEPNEAGPARAHLWAMNFVHDGATWAAGGPANKKALEDLGWDEQVEFIPYWRKGNGIKVVSSAEPVVASGWKRGERNLLVIVLNDSDQKTPCELTVDFQKFGFPPGGVKCRDYGHGGLAYPESFKEKAPREFAVERGKSIPFEIGAHSYKLLRYFTNIP